jgi:UDP-MurNAc hydroxylase
MKIQFVNHSSFIIESGDVRIISDPWLEGRVFNNGWDLISKTRLSYDDFKDINYIWFSHEHPDHFFPPNLKKIPAEYKKNITVLFQKTIDKRVAEYCVKAGFKKVIEMERNTFYPIGNDFEVMCEHFDEGDSWICYKTGGVVILNTNDCGITQRNQAENIRKKVGDVDILLTQFSYAYWAGNREDVEYRRQVADKKLDWMKLQIDVFQPKVTIPIASFVYFCHEENYYLNDSVNTAEKTYRYILEKTSSKPVVLYNGDEYTYPLDWDSLSAIKKYSDDFSKIDRDPSVLVKNIPVKEEELHEQARRFIDNLKSTNNKLILSLLKPVRIHLWDYNKTYLFSLQHYLSEEAIPYDQCDVSLSSESLFFCMKFPYGTDTTQINGRLQKPKNGNYSNFFNIFRIDQQKSRGQEMTLSYLAAVAFRKVLMKLGFRFG